MEGSSRAHVVSEVWGQHALRERGACSITCIGQAAQSRRDTDNQPMLTMARHPRTTHGTVMAPMPVPGRCAGEE